MRSSEGLSFCKGHGTENDFVVLPDPDGTLDLTPGRVAALCDRRHGLGADGVLRVVQWQALADGPPPEAGVTWFMDYRNADGSIAEMCGNGVRVYARYLAAAGLLDTAGADGAGELAIGTRAGVRHVRFAGGDPLHGEVSVDMGPAFVGENSTASIDGQAFSGISVDVGNPHLACVTDVAIASLDLTRPPGYDPGLFPYGVNVEFVSPLRGSDPGSGDEVEMRVHERGVGETRSCGTGTVAAVVAALREAGRGTGTVGVRVPGGRLRVTVDESTTTLHGPAVLVAYGELSGEWWHGVEQDGVE